MIHTNLKLGKTKAKKDPDEFKFAALVDDKTLPHIPETFGHQALVHAGGWGMLGNDSVGDCVFAGAAHETMLANAIGGHQAVEFTDHSVISDYSALTGYDPEDPSSDRGTDMKKAAKYRRQTGVLDKIGQRHTVVAYLALDPDDLTQYAQAAYLFGSIGLGIQFPTSAMDQFNAEKTWDVVKGSKIEGGHYVPLVGRLANGNWIAITWGRPVQVTPRFIEKYADETLAYLSHETLSKMGETPEGFDLAELKTMLGKL